MCGWLCKEKKVCLVSCAFIPVPKFNFWSKSNIITVLQSKRFLSWYIFNESKQTTNIASERQLLQFQLSLLNYDISYPSLLTCKFTGMIYMTSIKQFYQYKHLHSSNTINSNLLQILLTPLWIFSLLTNVPFALVSNIEMLARKVSASL